MNEKCIFSNHVAHDYNNNNGLISYNVKIKGVIFSIRYYESEIPGLVNFLQGKKYLIKGLLLNIIWHKENFTTVEVLDKLIENNRQEIPYTPKEKKDALINYIYKYQKFDGSQVNLLFTDFFWEELFFQNINETKYYTNYLIEEGLAKGGFVAGHGFQYILTPKAIEYYFSINEGKYSNSCFVAMAFNPEMDKIYEVAISPSIIETGFIPIIINREHLKSDVTINDGIIASIKKSKFTIADFTDNRSGVYFEAGYALGRGQNVIYTCKNTKEHKKALHFDINHYQHIFWDDAQDLKKKLIDKIEAFIK